MKNIRPAAAEDLARIAEIEIFNYRLNFYPIFQNDEFYFKELQVLTLAAKYEAELGTMWVYDDGSVKGFVQAVNGQIKKLFVEPVLQGNSIGSKLLQFAVKEQGGQYLWALEKNTRAIAFYQRHGFRLTGEKVPEDDTEEYLVKLIKDFHQNQ